MTQLVGEPSSGRAMLDLLFASRDGLVGDVLIGGHLGHSDHEMIDFSIFGEIRRNKYRQDFFITLLEGRLWPI